MNTLRNVYPFYSESIGAMTLRKMTLCIMTFSILGLITTLIINNTQHYVSFGCVSNAVSFMLSVIMLNVIWLSFAAPLLSL